MYSEKRNCQKEAFFLFQHTMSLIENCFDYADRSGIKESEEQVLLKNTLLPKCMKGLVTMHGEILIEEAQDETNLNKQFEDVQIEQTVKQNLQEGSDLYSMLYD